MAIALAPSLRRAALLLSLGLILSGGIPVHADAKGRNHHRDRGCEPPRAQRELVVRHRASCRTPAPVRYVRYRNCRSTPAPFRSVRTRCIRAGDQEYYWNVSLGFYVPGIWVSLEAGDLRDGVCFYDPYCERTFRSVASYRSHAVRCGHPAAVDVRFVSEGPRRHRDEDCAEQHWR